MRNLGIILAEILDAMDAAKEASLAVPFSEFANNRMLRLATERAIEIISEAVRHLPQDLLDRHPEIEWPKIKAIGNILRHEYHRIAPKVVWDAVQYDFESLEAALKHEQKRAESESNLP